MNRGGASGYNLLICEEGVQGRYLHPKGLSLLADKAAHIAVGLNAKALALKLAAGSGGEVSAGHEDHEAQCEFSNRVGVLPGGVHNHNAPGRCGRKVHVVKTCTCAYHNLELGSGRHHFLRHFVGTDDEGFGV